MANDIRRRRTCITFYLRHRATEAERIWHDIKYVCMCVNDVGHWFYDAFDRDVPVSPTLLQTLVVVIVVLGICTDNSI